VPPWQLNLHTKRDWEENWDVGSQTGPEYINRCVDIYSGLLGFCESASMCKWTVKSLKLVFHDIFMEKLYFSGGGGGNGAQKHFFKPHPPGKI
jgi:hypothetical protein